MFALYTVSTFGETGAASVKRTVAICSLAIALSGCMTAQERYAQAIQKMDASDDVYCRKQADNVTVTYDQCRERLIRLRQAAMAGAGAAASVDVGSSMRQAGAYLQAINPPPMPTVCTSTPWVGGIRTTCQ